MNISNLFKKIEEKEYTTFPKTLETYAWYKPILIFIIAGIFSLVISTALFAIVHPTAIEDKTMGLIYTSITVIAMIPGIYIGNKLLYKIPFSTQIAPIRKWNWGIYIKAMIITVVVYAVVQIIPLLTSGTQLPNTLPIGLLLLCVILPLFQGFAEEFLCRGLIMQTFGSWFKIPIVAIFLQAAIFCVMHNYQPIALIGVLCIGLLYGFITWYGQGLEVSSAMHAVNNIYTFLAIGFGLQGSAGSGVTLFSLMMNLSLIITPIIIIIALDKFNLISFES